MSLREAAAAYGLDPAELEPVASAYRPAAAYRAGPVLLKPYRYPERQLYYATRALDHLALRGFSRAPRLVRSRLQEPYIRAGGRLWYATTWIEGRRPRLPADLQLAANALAAFHRAARGCYVPWSPGRSWPARWARLLADLRRFERSAGAGSTPFDRAFAHVAPRFIGQAEAALAALQALDYTGLEAGARQEGFCHRDITAANLVSDRQGRVCLVDPDTWGAELRLHDLARLLITGCGWNPRTALTALTAYGPLSAAERRLLPAALLLPREVWWAGLCRYQRTQPGADPERLLRSAIAGAPARDACVKALREAL